MKKALILALGLLAMAVSCKKEEEIVTPRSVAIARQELTLVIGTEQSLSATVEPKNAADKSVSWNSSAPSVVSVSNEGVLKALAEGSAVITVSTFNGCTDKCFVSVWDGIVHVTGVKINQASVDLTVGERLTLSASVLPENASEKGIAWNSSSEDVATVSNTGEVTAVTPGKALIYAIAEDGGLSDKCVVTVSYSPVSVTVDEAKPLSCCTGSVKASFYVPDNAGSIKKGVIYSTESDASLSGSVWVEDKVSEGASVSVTLNPLMPSTHYYVRAWVSVDGTVFLSPVSGFETFGVNTLVQTGSASGIGVKKATLNASVNFDGTIFSAKQQGFKFRKAGDEWSRFAADTEQGNVLTLTKTDLVSNTTYEFCAYVSLDGRFYEGEVRSFTTYPISVNITKGIKDVENNEATISGSFTIGTDEPVSRNLYVYYSNTLTTAEELKAGGLRAEIVPETNGTFSYRLTGLKAGTTYRYLLSAVVDGWTHDTGVASIALPGYSIDVATLVAEDISFAKAKLRGTAVCHTNGSNPSMTGRFVYGTVNDPEQLKSSGTVVAAQYWGGDGIYYKIVSGLKSGTTYYYMAAVLCNGEMIYGPVESFSTVGIEEPNMVDMGVSVKWADFNIGATKPSEIGYYFSWGVPEIPDEYTWANYSLCTGSSGTIFRYTPSDGKTVLESQDDIANLLLGNGWRMPTKEECQELREHVTGQSAVRDGVSGALLTSTVNGNSIFIPMGGYYTGTSLTNEAMAYLWTSTVSSNGNCTYAWLMTVSSATNMPYTGNQTTRKDGCPVRAVKP